MAASKSERASARTSDDVSAAARSAQDEPFLQPWQFFLLGGMLAATATVIVATGQTPANIIILSITVVSVSFVGLGAYRMLAPLVAPDVEAPVMIGGRTRIALEREKTLVLRSIKELEFDFAMRKMSQADFDEMAGRLRMRALGLMEQLDAGGGYRDQIAQEIARRLGGLEGATSPDESVATPDDASGRTCPECEVENDPDARFCKSCGHRLNAD
jgi:hypothetical protein